MAKDFRDVLKELASQLPDEDGTEFLEENPIIPDPFGVALDSSADISEKKIFITRFSESDVDDFSKLLNASRLSLNNKHLLINRFSEFFALWKKDHPTACPYEPFLWALKCKDKYIGSIQNNATPQSWQVEFVGDILYSVWEDDNPDYKKVLNNVLTNWDWYQPIHVMLYVYKRLTQLNDEAIDKYIRDNLMYRALYSEAAFFCLCDKKKTEENIKALMRFVSQDAQRDLNMSEIQITKRMLSMVEKYLRESSQSEFAVAQTYYTDELFSCGRKARAHFDGIFFKSTTIEEELKTLENDWKAQSIQEQESLALQTRLRAFIDRDAISTIKAAATARSDKMISAVLELIEQRGISFHTQFWLREMGNHYLSCPEYNAYIEKKYTQKGKPFLTDESFVFGCAYCRIGHPEILEALFDAFYFNMVGIVNGRFIFLSLQTFYSRQYKEQTQRIANICMNDESKALQLISTCAKIFNKTSTYYPVIFDRVCDFLMKCVRQNPRNAVRYVVAVIDLIEKVATINNRERYLHFLEDIIELRGLQFEQVRDRAKKVIRDVFGNC